MVSIREANHLDSESINSLSKHLGYAALPIEQASGNLASLLHSAVDYVYVAEVNGKVVGWIHSFFSRRLASPSFYEIVGLVVEPEYRGRGIGKQLVVHVTDKYRGKWRVRCNEKRLETHKFYEAINFNGCKIQHVFEKRSGIALVVT